MSDINLNSDPVQDIFEAVPPQEGRNYFKFEKIGDKVQGTYIARDDNSVNGYGAQQTLVSLMQQDGNVATVAIRHSKTGLLKILSECKLGEILGFQFTGEKPNPGKQPTKFIRLVHDPKIVDKNWLQSRGLPLPAETPSLVNINPTPTVITPQPIAPVAQPAASDPVQDKIMQITALAKQKLGATDEASIKQLVMDKTGLAFININLDLILQRLQAI